MKTVKLLNAMIARYLLANPGALPSKTTVLQLATWLQDNPETLESYAVVKADMVEDFVTGKNKHAALIYFTRYSDAVNWISGESANHAQGLVIAPGGLR